MSYQAKIIGIFCFNIIFSFSAHTQKISSDILRNFEGRTNLQENSKTTIESEALEQLKALSFKPPVVYSSFFGGPNSFESITDIAVDGEYVYMIGFSDNSHQWYLAKLKIGETDFEFINWYGTIGLESSKIPRQVKVDNDGNVVCVITTNDPGLPTKNAIRSNFAIDPYIIDLYIIKTDSNGETIFATYFGGQKVDPANNPLRLNGRDYFGGMVFDSLNNIFITGETDGANFPTTENALYTNNQGRWDLFLSKLSPNGELLYSTILGGPEKDRINTGSDVKHGIDIDDQGRVYLIGRTESDFSVFPEGDLALDKENEDDEFVITIFDSNNDSFIYSSLLSEFEPKFLKVDSKNRVHLAGFNKWRNLVNPISTEGRHSLFTFKPLNRQVIFSSYLPCDKCSIENLTVDKNDHLIFSAQIRDEDVPITDSIDYNNVLGRYLYVGSIDVEKAEFNFAVPLGGSGSDNAGGGLEVSSDNSKLYIGGVTYSTDLFVTPNAWALELPGNGDGFLSILEIETPQPSNIYRDANPLFVKNASVETIRDIDETRDIPTIADRIVEGVVSDGISEIILQIPIDEKAKIEEWKVEEKYGKIENIWSNEPLVIDDQAYVFALYTPPLTFPTDDEDDKVELTKNEGIEVAVAPFKVVYKIEDESFEKETTLNIYRPPVVLVHGTFDNPESCWKTGFSPSANGLYQELQRQGFKVFTCDYSNTNGLQKIGSCATSEFSNVNNRISSFECNKRVVYDNPGGIKEAVDFFRNTLKVACTQADAIGHSMGGVLIRVYASDRVANNVISYETNYYRNDNFQKGDIHRVITLASTHHGSDVAWLLNEVAKGVDPSAKGFFEYILPDVVPYAWIGAMYEKTGAVQDQVPQSPALRRIGPTKIPAHAMTFYANDVADVKNDLADADQFYYKRLFQIGMALYFYESVTDHILTNIALEWDRLPQHLKEPKDRYYKSYDVNFLDTTVNKLEKFKELYKAPLEKNYDIFYSMSKEFINSSLPFFEERTISILQYEFSESSINDFDNDEHINYINKRIDLFREEMEESASGRSYELIEDLMNKYRFLIFKNDWNDGTVRYDSQTGSLDDKKYVSRFTKHLHSFAPRYPESISKVVSLLKGGMADFAIDGFPNAGRKLPLWLPDMEDNKDPDVTGCEAACWSGMVPDHAMAWARVADSANVIILNRPVNPDATPLIHNHASTKGMNLKGKSSDWGPQKGLITVNQRFSKMWNLYEEPELSKQVKKFDKKVEALLKDNPEEAIKRQLEKIYHCDFIRSDTTFRGWLTKPKEFAEDEIRFTGVSDQNTVYTWFESSTGCPLAPCESDCNISELDTFYVLANPNPKIAERNNGMSPVYTADYDLLAFGFFEAALFNNPNYTYPRPDFHPLEVNFDCEMGIMTEDQKRVLAALNQSVRNLGYKGGNVAHHGPENQFTNMSFSNFPCSESITNLEVTANPYFDYPITAFEPDEIRGQSAGVVRTIQMGPPGYKDINLKRYMADVRRRGYDIIANPNSPSWQWEYWRPYSYEEGYDDRDYPDLPSYPEQLPKIDLQKCIDQYGCLEQKPKANHLHQVLNIKTKRFKASDKFAVFPNPVGNAPVNLLIKAENQQRIKIVIVDVIGKIKSEIGAALERGINEMWLDTQSLSSGQYYIVTSVDGKAIYAPFIVVK